MKKTSILLILISIFFPVIAQVSGPTLEEYCNKLLGLKKQELKRLENGEKGIEGYALYGNNAPACLITGDDFTDQLVSSKSRINILNIEIASLENVLASLNQQTPNINSSGSMLSPIADSHVYAYSYSNWNRANWGKYEVLGAGWNPTGGEKRSYLKFDVSGIDKSTFEKAVLKLYHYHNAGTQAAELGVYTVRSSWNEGNGTYKPANIATSGEICWINQPSIDPYPVAYFNPGASTNKFIEVDITTLVKSWLNGMPNHGMAIKAGENYVSGPESMYGFYAREHSDVDKRPALIINGGGQKIITTTPTENLVKNGSFEQPVVGSYKSYYPGQDIEGWQVIKAAVDITGTYFKSSEGKQSIDLHGTGGFGGIQQTIATKPNTKYTLTFDFAGNAVGGPTVKEMKVSAAGQSQVFKFDCTGKSTQNMGWVGQTWQFVANSTNTILIFETLTTSGVDRYGPAIDNVKVMEGSGLGQIVSNDSNNLPIFEDFSKGLGKWDIGDNNAGISDGKLFFHTGNSLLGTFNKEVPMENIEIEFDGYTETNGINVYLHNDKSEGYIVFMGGWFNAQSGSDVGKVAENRELTQGKVWKPKQWHHYKVIKCGNTLSTFCDGRKIYERNISRKFNGKGKIKFSSWNTRIGIDNIKVSMCSVNQITTEGKLYPINITGEWHVNQHNGFIGTFTIQQNQSGHLTGNASWDRHASGTISGQVSGNSVEFTISYPNGIKGIYKGNVTQNGMEIVQGNVTASDGRTSATWEASKVDVDSSITGEWKVNQSTGHHGILRFQVNTMGQFTGSASWNGNLFGSIKGSVSGKAIEFTISYPGNVTGLYKGILSNDGTKIRNGTTEGSNGVRATWEASR